MEKVIQQNQKAWSGFKAENTTPQSHRSGKLMTNQLVTESADSFAAVKSSTTDDTVIYSTWFMAGHHLNI